MFRNASKYRNAAAKAYAPECTYSIPTSASTSAGVGGDATRVAATHDRLILNGYTSLAGEVQCIPLWSSEKGEFARNLMSNTKPYTFRAHGTDIVDLVVNPATFTLIAGGTDGHISVHQLSDEKYDGAASSVATFAEDSKRINTLGYHPTCGPIFASGSDAGDARILDIEKSRVVATLHPEGANSVHSLDWNHNGSLLAFTTDSGSCHVHIGDPRQAASVQSAQVHDSKHGSRVLWLGHSDHTIITTGFGKFRNREMSMWDTRNMSKSVFKKSGESSSTVAVPLFDSDTGVLIVGGRADSNLEAYEVTSSTPFLRPISSYSGSKAQKDICLVPKRGLDVMSCEVMRVIRAGVDVIEPVSYNVPRRTRRSWADVEDLYPDTASKESTVAVDAWLGGEDGIINKVSLNPANNKKVGSAADADAAAADSGPDTAAATAGSEATPGASGGANAPVGRVATLAAPETAASRLSVSSTGTGRGSISLVRESHFRNNFATPYKPELTYYEIHASLSAYPESNGMTLNSKYFAVPWTGNGGQMAVINHAHVGRFSRDRSPIIETGSTITDLQFSPFHDEVIGLGGEDAGVRIVSFNSNLAQAEPEIIRMGTHASRVTCVQFHPTASSILLSGAGDASVKLWDVECQQEVISYNPHEDSIASFAFDYPGSKLVSTGKDAQIKISDPRSGEVISGGKGHDNSKGSRVVWLGDTPYLATTGFSRSSERQVSTWDSRKLGTALCTKVVDVGSRILMPFYDEDTHLIYVAGKGDTSIVTFEIESGEPTEMHRLQNFTGSAPLSAIAWWPKRELSIANTEIARFYRLCGERLEPVKFTVPRTRKQYFQDDIYPDTRSGEAAVTGGEWMGGGDHPPRLQSVRPVGMDLLSTAPAPVTRQSAADKFKNDIAADERIDKTDQVFNQFINKITDFRDNEVQEEDSDSDSGFDWS